MLSNLAKEGFCRSLGIKDHSGLSGWALMKSHVSLKQGGTRRLDTHVHAHRGEDDVRIERREMRRHWY